MRSRVLSLLPVRAAFGVALAPTLISLWLEAIAALAQGALAIALGSLARFLGGAARGAPEAAGMTWMSRVLSRVPLAIVPTSATSVALAGLLAVAIGAGARILLETRETRDAAHLAARARLSVLSSALAGAQRSIGVATTVPHEVELGARAERARVRSIVHLTVLALVILALDARLALIVIAILAPFAVLLRPVRRAIRASHLAATQGAIDTIDACRDVLEHAPVWATCGGAALAMSRVEALSREGTELSSRAARARVAASASNELLAALAILVLVAVFAPARTTLLPVLIALVSAYRPIRDLAESSPFVERGARAAAQCPGTTKLATARAWPGGTFVARSLAVDVGNDVEIDLELRPGRIAALVGPPGSGKSALLEAIAGVRPCRGQLSIGGARFDEAPIGTRPIAWVPPSPPVLPATLDQNLAPNGAPDRARAVLAELGGAPARGDQILRRVSSGEAQRIALARALASDAPVLLLDEPTANLDAESERIAIAVIQRELGDRCAVIVTHRPAPLAIADQVFDLERTVRAPESERRIA